MTKTYINGVTRGDKLRTSQTPKRRSFNSRKAIYLEWKVLANFSQRQADCIVPRVTLWCRSQLTGRGARSPTITSAKDLIYITRIGSNVLEWSACCSIDFGLAGKKQILE